MRQRTARSPKMWRSLRRLWNYVSTNGLLCWTVNSKSSSGLL